MCPLARRLRLPEQLPMSYTSKVYVVTSIRPSIPGEPKDSQKPPHDLAGNLLASFSWIIRGLQILSRAPEIPSRTSMACYLPPNKPSASPVTLGASCRCEQAAVGVVDDGLAKIRPQEYHLSIDVHATTGLIMAEMIRNSQRAVGPVTDLAGFSQRGPRHGNRYAVCKTRRERIVFLHIIRSNEAATACRHPAPLNWSSGMCSLGLPLHVGRGIISVTIPR